MPSENDVMPKYNSYNSQIRPMDKAPTRAVDIMDVRLGKGDTSVSFVRAKRIQSTVIPTHMPAQKCTILSNQLVLQYKYSRTAIKLSRPTSTSMAKAVLNNVLRITL